MHNRWTQAAVWRWPEGRGSGRWVEVGNGGGGMGASVIVTTRKIKLNMFKKNTVRGFLVLFLFPLRRIKYRALKFTWI